MMRTYWNNEETYQKKFKNGWYITGDRSSIDNDGYFWFAGRDDDIINTAGHLVSPFEVESALLEHPAVAESAVVSQARPDQHGGRQGLRHAQARLHGQRRTSTWRS